MLSDLSRLLPGESGEPAEIMPSPLRRKLLELGFLSHPRITALFAAPTGDPVAYALGGTVVALRKKDARWVRIRV
ncbi:MAG: ferrous iron transport protein A [Clostridia bacterium]|nr:ferrous iron transport protein A [Clostridia bacterium]